MTEEDEDPDYLPTRRQWAGYWCMIAQQTQNAFNDKAAQFLLIPLAGALGLQVFGMGIESAAGIMIALPFILFAPLSGWLSDRFSKRNVLLGAAIAQSLILASMALAVHLRSMPLALCGFFALAVQSAFFSPAKIGINKELVGHRHLGFAAGIQQMAAMFAMLIGQIAAGILYDRRWEMSGLSNAGRWTSAGGPLLLLTLASLPAIVLALTVPRTPAHGAERLRPALLVRHFAHVRELWAHTGLRRASFAVAYFWGFAAFINLWSVKVAKSLTDGEAGFGTLSSWFMAAASLGMVGGFGLSSYLLRRRIEIGWVPVAGVAMTLSTLLLGAVDPSGTLALLGDGHPLAAALHPSAGGFLAALALVAFCAALFLAPLNAWMQDRYPPAKRGEFQAAVNLQDCITGILAAVVIELLQLALTALGLAPLDAFRLQLGVVALSCGFISWFIIRLLPSDFIRVIGLGLMGLFYRIRAVNPQHVPTQGGALLLPNHVSWADAFFLTAASPRPVRFVMDAAYMRKPLVAAFCRTFDTVPIELGQPREALRTAAEALAAGDVVCLFPEGQLSRTGTLQKLKRGFELIARKGGAPVVPVWTDGLWGSIFSFERNRFFTKTPYRLPRRMAVSFGPPLTPAESSLPRIRDAIHRAAAAALRDRMEHSGRPQRANAWQIAQLNALAMNRPYALEDSLAREVPALRDFANLTRARLDERVPVRVGTDDTRARIERGDLPAPGTFFDFSTAAADALTVEGWNHLPCLALAGQVIAMSMPPHPLPLATSRPQPTAKPGSRGVLLPGFFVEERDGRLVVLGPPLPDAGIPLPPGSRIDDEDFLFLP